MTGGGNPLAILLLALLLGSGTAELRGHASAGGAGEPPLTMEELEIRGRREKPEELYLPPPGEIRHAPPVPFDLIREDMTRPILPREIHGPIRP
jgi:hypothetical protein